MIELLRHLPGLGFDGLGVIADQAVGDHQVVGLVALGTDLPLHAHRHASVDGQGHRQQQPSRRQEARPSERGDHGGRRQGEQRRSAQRAQTGHRQADEEQQGDDGQAGGPTPGRQPRPPGDDRTAAAQRQEEEAWHAEPPAPWA